MKVKHGILLIVLLAIDQISKFAVDANMKLQQSMDIVPGFFRITYLHNTGAAWSMLEGKMWFFYIITAIALVAMIYFYVRSEKQDVMFKTGIVCMAAGTIGNLIDRLMFQYVRDFIDFIILGYDFPVFNVADMALCFGVFLIIIDILLEERGVKV
ncbi:signal peptidase II [[Eubacterium] hominis]|uniref:signal peptidase II n=1 Tax=[Eubacterium] hominis TaxID=2764325 RepID=UPI003A4D544A